MWGERGGEKEGDRTGPVASFRGLVPIHEAFASPLIRRGEVGEEERAKVKGGGEDLRAEALLFFTGGIPPFPSAKPGEVSVLLGEEFPLEMANPGVVVGEGAVDFVGEAAVKG